MAVGVGAAPSQSYYDMLTCTIIPYKEQSYEGRLLIFNDGSLKCALPRELAGGGQKSVKLTTSLVSALTSGLTVFAWHDVGSIYHPILTNILSWASRPPSG